MTEKPLPGWALPDKAGNVDYPVGPLMRWGAEMQVHIGAETGDLTACGMPGARRIQKLRVGQPVCPGCRFKRGPITDVLRGRIMESGLTVEEFARRVVLRGPRTVYGWLSGDPPSPGSWPSGSATPPQTGRSSDWPAAG